MTDNVKLVKLISGDTVLGIFDEEEGKLKDIALVQAIPNAGSPSNLQIAILPFGFPYEDEIGGEIDMDKILYEYRRIPEDLKNKYLEEKSNIRISSSMPNIDPSNMKNDNSSGGLIF
ncbi:MAG: hypothetical protein SVN78_05325 [Deferribacterota bacterium]|nr:hypothetical protein [Deferribacterota bacterium]